MRDLVEKEVDGEIYKIEQFNTTKSIRILTRLSKIAGPTIANAMRGQGFKSQVDQNAAMGEALAGLLSSMDEEMNVKLAKEMVESVLKGEGAKINFEQDFKGRLGHLLKLLVAVTEVNYSNFLEDLLALVPEAGSQLKAQSTG